MQADDEIPILGQVQECEAFAKSKDWEVVHIYKDEGFTGTQYGSASVPENARRCEFKANSI